MPLIAASPTALLAALAALAAVATGLYVATRRLDPPLPPAFAALCSAGFLAFTALAAWQEGPLGFWPEHTRHLWGNQIWFDLLLMATGGWILAAPRARAVGMPRVPWFLFIVATGSIGFMAFLARLMQLEAEARA